MRGLEGEDPHMPEDHAIFEAGDLVLQSGETLRHARLAYKTYGNLNAEGDNAVLLPSWYSGNHHGYEFLLEFRLERSQSIERLA